MTAPLEKYPGLAETHNFASKYELAVHALASRMISRFSLLTLLLMIEGQITSQNGVLDFCDFEIM